MSIAQTARLGLPLLSAGQAQKEIVHNEALVLADLALHPVAETLGDTDPPLAPESGQAWITGADPTGAWNGHAHEVAAWTEGGWRFIPAIEGMHVFLRADGIWARFLSGTWQAGVLSGDAVALGGIQVVGAQQPSISDPSGGAVTDAEARACLHSILVALRSHGLISP